MEQFLHDLRAIFSRASHDIGTDAAQALLPYATFVIRILLPLLALLILIRCIRSLLREKYEPEVWGYLSLPNATHFPLHHWENVIGRAPTCDVALNYPSLSRNHLALMRDDDARWTAIDLASKGGVMINGQPMDAPTEVFQGDIVNMGGVEVTLLELLPEEVRAQKRSRTRPGWWIRPSGTFFFLTLFQALLAAQHSIAALGRDRFTMQIPLAFGGLAVIMWSYFFFVRAMRRTGFEVESLAFFLTTLGLSIIASHNPAELVWTLSLVLAGVVFFVLICWIMRDLKRAKSLHWPIAIAGIAFLALGFLLADEIGGAQRWIDLGFTTIQPSEFVKLAFIFAGAATLERLFARKNLFLFIGYSGLCLGILALMNDFGSAAVFFTAFLMIAFLRSGDFATIALSLAALAFAGFLVLTMRPHVAARFGTWGNAWETPFGAGMQQVQTMMSTASGGLLGLGAGQGVLHRIVASETDMVFGILAEELGLLVAIFAVVSIVVIGIFAIRAASSARSSFYVIAAGAAVTMMITQVILNVFGPLDVIPFTGMTFPFVSRGGSSMVASWGLLAFIKAVDTRQNASLAVKLNRKTADIRYNDPWSGAAYDNPYSGEYTGYPDEYDNIPIAPTDDSDEIDPQIDPRYFD